MGRNGSEIDDCQQHLRRMGDLASLYMYYSCRNDTNFTAKILDFQDQLQRLNRRELPVLATILTLFGLLIILGAAGNGLVIHLICTRRALGTPRHAFVLNLALSDFILCTVTQPINVLRLLQEYLSWEYGAALCKLVNGLTGLNLFVSTFSIMAIALDRFQAVVHPNHLVVRRQVLVACIALIWAAAALLASPLVLFASVTQNWLMLHRRMHMCSESSDSRLIRTAKVMYSAGALLAQYLIPLVILSLAYWRIHARLERKIQYRRESCQSAYQQERCQREEKRHRRTNAILLTIGLVFALSWLPLSLFNLLTDVQAWRLNPSEPARSSDGRQIQLPVQLLQSVSLLLILMSACVNPILYGFLNDCLKTELFKLLGCTRFLHSEDAENASNHHRTSSAAEGVQLPLIAATFDPQEVDAWIDDSTSSFAA